MVAEAVFRAFTPYKMNYELLGNTDEHMHWHLFPRRKTDKKADTAVWSVPKEERSNRSTEEEIGVLKRLLAFELDNLVRFRACG